MRSHHASPPRQLPTVAPTLPTHVDLRDASEAEFRVLAAKIARETTFPCESYKPQVLRRRIAVRMRACDVDGYAAYARILDTDRHEYARLLDVLTVNVTRFFRDASTYDALAAHVVPTLWSERRDDIAVWSAGMASGEEAYSLAALFHEEARRRDELSGLGRVRIVGTDIDRMSLLAAARAEYPPSAFRETPVDVLERLFPRIDDAHVGEIRGVATQVRALVNVQRRDLLRDAPPGQFDLITCRNVIIYLDRAAQEQLVSTLHAALRPGGYLVLGRAEMLLGASRARFAPVVARERIFRRVDGPLAHGASRG